MISEGDFKNLYKLTSCISQVNDVAKYILNIPPERADHLRDAYSYGQLTSKVVALNHLCNIQESNNGRQSQIKSRLVWSYR